MTYSVRDWSKNFEKAQTRNVERVSWVAVPVKHDGLSYKTLMLRDDGPTIFAAWVLILQVAAKCPERGVLKNDRGPIGPQQLAIITGAPVSIFELALPVLASPEIGWLSVDRATIDALSADYQPVHSSYQRAVLQTDRQTSITEQDITDITVCSEPATPPTEPPLVEFPIVAPKGKPKTWGLTQAKVDEYQETYPGLDVLGQARKARQWCIDNPSKRKTAKGMPAFLNRWLEKAQNTGGGTRGHPAHVNGEPAGRLGVEPVRPEDPAEAHRRWEEQRRKKGLPAGTPNRLRLVGPD